MGRGGGERRGAGGISGDILARVTTPIERMAVLTDLLLQGWQTPESIARSIGVKSGASSSMLREILWVGLPLECHRVGSESPRYRLLPMGRDQAAAARSRTPSGSMALLVWELSRTSLSKRQIAQLVGASDRAIKRHLAAIRAVGLPLRWSELTSHGAYRGFRTYQLGRQTPLELDGRQCRVRGLEAGREGRQWVLEGVSDEGWEELRSLGLPNDCGCAEAREAFGL